MTLESFGSALNYFLILLVLGLWILVIIRFIKNKCAPVKIIRAQVLDKYKTQTVSKIQGTLKRERYVVVFSGDGKRLSFDVSEVSFKGYKIGERGTLKYKGNRLIDFS